MKNIQVVNIIIPLLLWAFYIWMLLYIANKDTNLTMLHSDTLIKHDQSIKEIESKLDWLKNINERVDFIRDETYKSLDEIELKKNGRIYNLEITICKLNEEKNEIIKRKVVMNDVVAINPSVERTATVVDAWFAYGSSIEIPTITEKEYACDLKVLSIK